MTWRINLYIILFCLVSGWNRASEPIDSFRWGNATYYNMNIGQSIGYNGVNIKLLSVKNHYSLLLVDNDSVWLKVSRRSIPEVTNGLKIFVADNRAVKALTTDSLNHGLLTGDALVCIADFNKPLLDRGDYVFPISFNDGYTWGAGENSHMFSYLGLAEWKEEGYYRSHEGIDFDMHDARGKNKHWLVAIENSTVVWVEDKALDEAGKEACVLLESNSQPGIYYVYKHLYNRNVEVKQGQKVLRGEPLGTIWGDHIWGHLHFAVVKSDTVPSYTNRYHNLVNAFPQIYELYFTDSYYQLKSYTKGRITFGRLRSLNRNEKNAEAYENYSGKGWITGAWNAADKVEWAMDGDKGNARLSKILFRGTPAECENPDDYYDYEISVKNGTYRIRARIGDVELPSYQKILFEDAGAGVYELEKGEQSWTPERIVKVNDGKLTVRIYVDSKNNAVAGLSEIVFQSAN